MRNNDLPVPCSPIQKAVAALVAIGQPKASEILKHLSRAEVKLLISAAKTMKAVTQDNLELIVRDFEMEFTRGTGLLDSASQIEKILSESFDAAELATINGEALPTVGSPPAPKDAWEVLAQAESQIVADFLVEENPQVGAYVLSRLTSPKSAEILSLMERSARAAMMTRMMSISEISKEAEGFIEHELLSQFGQVASGTNKAILSRVATILNELDRDATEEVLLDMTSLVEADDVLAIKAMLFRFDDIPELSTQARMTAFDAIPVEILTLALREAAPHVVEAALSAISQRSRRMIENDLKSKIQVRPLDVANARKRIVNEIMRLAGTGRLELPQPKLEAA